jgi:N-acetylglucosamine kinase-like BadF-type ATPase
MKRPDHLSPYILGVDGGGTKALAFLVHAEQGLVGRGLGGASNPQSAGEGAARAALLEAVTQACAALPPGAELAAAAFGLAGLDTPSQVAEGERFIADLLAEAGLHPARLLVENDGWIALKGASSGGRGLLIIAGTGSITLATDGQQVVRVGGWGHQVGDVCSAYEIARAGVAATYARHDHGEDLGALGAHLCRRAGVADLDQLHTWLYGPGAEVEVKADLAVAVCQAAEEGDPAAIAILRQAGEALGQAAVSAARQVGLADGAPFPAFLVGGVLRNARIVREGLTATLAAALPGARVQPPRYPPVMGAVLVALNLAGLGDQSERLLATLSL